MRASPGSSESGQLPGLTGLRCVAVFLVYAHHFNPVADPGHFWHRMFAEGHIGVSLFFTLSGFLITYRYFPFSATSPFIGWTSLRNYYAARIARIWPMYLLLTGIGLFLMKATSTDWWMNLTLLKGFSDHWKFSAIPQTWSLTVEETFYFFAPLIFAGLHRWARPGKGMLRRLILASAALTAAVWALVPLLCAAARAGGWPFFENVSFVLTYTYFGRCFEFHCGIVAAIAWRQGWRPKMTLPAVAALFVVVWSMTWFQGTVGHGIFHPAGLAINNLILPLAETWLIVSVAAQPTILQRLLDTRLARLLGAASYVFYLIHLGVIREVLVFWTPWKTGWQAFLWLNLCAVVLYGVLERPTHHWLRKILSAPN